MKTRYIMSVMAFVMTLSVNGQDQLRAIQLSQNFPIGTARYQAMGGAFGALGADFSAASQNPAGLGLYRGNEFTITPSYVLNNSRSEYLGETTRDNVTNFSIGNLGMVATYSNNQDVGLVSTTLGFGYNALNNFHSTTFMRGVNNNSSLLDNFAWYANNSNELDGFYEELAFQTAVMPFDTVQQSYWHYLEPYDLIGYEGYGQEQIRVLERRGYLGEYAFSAAFNFSHKLYVGGTFGIHSVRYYEDIDHIEKDYQDLEPDFNSFEFKEYNTTRGYGYVFKMGVIFKPIHMLRIGASFHAPTVYQLTDDKFTEMVANFDVGSGIPNSDESSGIYSKEYTLRTPYRASLSAAVVLGKLGLISAEYEYVDYTISDLDSPGYNFIDENIAITEDFRPAHNIKAGAEIRLNSIALRAGAQYYMNPYSDSRNGSDMMVYSAGIGVRSGSVFFDISYSLATSRELYGLYHHTPALEEGFERAVNSYNKTNVMVTLGYKF